MTFLTPIPAIIAGAVTVPILLALYLLKLRRRPIRVSSTMLWESAVADLQVNAPFRWLRASLLLLLHLLILLLLLLAMARPAAHLADRQPRRVVLLIDRSASMSARDAGSGQTRLDRARERAISVIDGLLRGSSGSEVVLVAFAAEPRALTGFTASRSILRGAIKGITPTDQPGDLARALRLAQTLLSAEVREGVEPEPGLVVLISDGSFPPAGYQLSGATLRYVMVGATKDDPAQRPRDNLGIVALSARRDYEDPSVLRVFARVANAGAAPVETSLSLALDGRIVQRRAITVPAAAGGSDSSPIHPGQASATFEVDRLEGGVVTVGIDRTDLLDSDNSASLVADLAHRPAVLLVARDAPVAMEQLAAGPDDRPPAADPDWALIDPLLAMGVSRLVRVDPEGYARLDAEGDLGTFDLAIYRGVRPDRLPPVPSISFGAGMPIPGLGLGRAEPGQAGSTYVISWRRDHPILRDVSLDTVLVGRRLLLSVPDPDGGLEDEPGKERTPGVRFEALATGRDGPLILLARVGSTPHVLVAFDPSQSNWPLDVGFTVFMANAVQFLSPAGGSEPIAATTTREPVLIDAPARVTEARLVDLDGEEVVARRPEGLPADASRPLSVGLIERAGVYVPVQADDAIEPVAVNLLDEWETSIGVEASVSVGGEEIRGAGSAGEPREVWQWFVLAAACLLFIEWTWYAWRMRV